MSSRHGLLGAAALLVIAAVAAIAWGDPVSRVDDGCRLFPRTSHWNQRVDGLPVARGSDQLVRKIGRGKPLFADFTIPYTVVPGDQPRKAVRFRYRGESDPGPYPIPAGVPIEGGIDRHALIVDRDRCRLYELYDLHRNHGQW